MAAAAAVELLDLSTLDPEAFPARLEAVLQANLDKIDALADESGSSRAAIHRRGEADEHGRFSAQTGSGDRVQTVDGGVL